MAYKLDPMDLKQILSLHLDGYSNRKIGRTLGLSRNTINGYLKLFKSCEIPITELINKTEQELRELFPSHSTINNSRFEALMSYFEKVNLARNKPGFTFLYHYQEYAHSVSEPSISRMIEFCLPLVISSCGCTLKWRRSIHIART
jgi:biotin operon repressor